MQHGPYRLKRYYSLREYDQQAFGCRVAKIPLNAGLGCPNRDGSKGVGGCIFCSQAGSGEFAGRPEQPLRQQFEAGREKVGFPASEASLFRGASFLITPCGASDEDVAAAAARLADLAEQSGRILG